MMQQEREQESNEAIPLFELLIHKGGLSSWGYFQLAGAVWKTSGDKAKTLHYLREGVVRDYRDPIRVFGYVEELQALAEDPEVIAMLKR